MLSIQIEWSKEKFELNVVGHAGYAEHGKDIVLLINLRLMEIAFMIYLPRN